MLKSEVKVSRNGPERPSGKRIIAGSAFRLEFQAGNGIMTMTQQWRYLNFTRNSFYISLPAKGIMISRQIISSHLYLRLKGTCSLASRVLSNTGG